MGMYDTIFIDGREGQVKIWENRMYDYVLNDEVPPLAVDTYSIVMREGGYVHVINHRIAGWEDEPLDGAPIYDKYGTLWTGENQGLFKEVFGQDAYFFKR